MSDDIVARLRIAWTSCTDRINKEREEAADEIERLRAERDEARRQTRRIRNEIDCRIEHGAESGGHLEAIYSMFKENTDDR